MARSSDNHEQLGGRAPLVFDRRLLLKRRDRAAKLAASGRAPDFLLSWVADDIAERLSVIKRDFQRILNLGAHNGRVGRMLRDTFPEAVVFEADACPRMLGMCDGPAVVAEEDHLPFAHASLDLVVSGLSLQFVNDLPGALVQIRRVLRPDGLFIGAMAGGGTLHEMRSALTEAELALSGGVSPRVAPFVDVRELGGLLQRAGFALPVTDTDTVDVSYQTLFHLMRELRGMGATNVLAERRREPAPRALFFEAARIYQETFGVAEERIRATFEIVTMTAWAPDASQQQPLRPGSAKMRLADALGTIEKPSGETP